MLEINGFVLDYDRYADHLLAFGSIPVDMDTDGGTGHPGYGPRFPWTHRMDSTRMALHLCNVVDVRRKRDVSHSVRYLQPGHPQRITSLSQLESQKVADEPFL